MISAKKCTLIITEPSIKEIILMIGSNENFIVKEINDKALCITREAGVDIQTQVDNILNK